MKHLKLTAIIMAMLVIMLPICFATEMNLVYDPNGNLQTGDGKFREYNSLNQLSKVYNGSDDTGMLLIEYFHHPTEERVLKKHDYVKNETTYYFSETFARVVNESGTYNLTFVYLNGDLVAEQTNSDKTFIHSDHLSSSTIRTDNTGTILERTEYSPFGEPITGGSSKLDYEAEEYDETLGEYDFDFRMYKAEWGMFTKPDTLIPNVYDPQSLNRYMFERGNPYRYMDPSGHGIKGFLFGIVDFARGTSAISTGLAIIGIAGASPIFATVGAVLFLGGLIVAGYGAVEMVSSIFTTNSEDQEIHDTLDQFDTVSDTYNTIVDSELELSSGAPKAESAATTMLGQAFTPNPSMLKSIGFEILFNIAEYGISQIDDGSEINGEDSFSTSSSSSGVSHTPKNSPIESPDSKKGIAEIIRPYVPPRLWDYL